MSANPPKPQLMDLLTDQMRAHLGVSHRQNRPGGAFGIHKKPYHRPWANDQPPVQVETVYANGPQPELRNRRDEAQQAALAAQEERVARERVERQLREKEAARIALETRLGHAELAKREAEMARREAESRLQAIPEAQHTEPAIPQPTPAKPPQDAPQAKRAYVRHKPLKVKAPLYDHPKPPTGRPKGYKQSTGTFDYSRYPSTERRWVFAKAESAAPTAPEPANPAPTAPEPANPAPPPPEPAMPTQQPEPAVVVAAASLPPAPTPPPPQPAVEPRPPKPAERLVASPYWPERDTGKLRERIAEAVWNPMEDSRIDSFKEAKRRRFASDSQQFDSHTASIMAVELTTSRIMRAIEEEGSSGGSPPHPAP